MGAYQFGVTAKQGPGEALETVFRRVVEDARYEHGHGGYTGTIAEKDSVITIKAEPVTMDEARLMADILMNKDDSRVTDKWGPAGAIRVIDPGYGFDGWYFFGWASS